MKQALQNFFGFQVIRQDRSKINGLIQVVMVLNRPRLMVGGMIQSGGLVRKIWDRGIKKIIQEELEVSEALILGFGGGDCAFKINQYYPKAKVTGVEIDEKILEVSKSYFNLNQLKKLNLVIDDGVKFLNKTKDKYDVVIVDIFLGQKTPSVFKTQKFFKSVKKRLNENGVLIFNHLFFKEYKEQAQGLIKTMELEFTKIRLVRVAGNLLILASN